MTTLLQAACALERVGIVFNPSSGTQDCAARRSLLEKMVRAAGLTCDLVETHPETGAVPAAEDAVRQGLERLLISGGDGSITEAAGVLAGTETALAVLPGGTGNLLAVNLGIPGDCDRALRLAITGEVRPIDVGRANGTVFLIMAGIGADARMIHDADRELKRRYGVLAYVIAAARNVGRRPAAYRINIDGVVRIRRAQTVMVANLGRITGGVPLIPDTDPEDGLLEVAVLRVRNFPSLALLLLRRLLGQHAGDDLMQVYRGRSIEVTTRRPQPVQVDGNEAGRADRLSVHVEPSALQIVRPPLSKDGTSRFPRTSREWLPIAVLGGLLLVPAVRQRAGEALRWPAGRMIAVGGVAAAAAPLIRRSLIGSRRAEEASPAS